MLSTFPNELQQVILGHLSVYDLIRVGSLSKTTRAYVEMNCDKELVR